MDSVQLDSQQTVQDSPLPLLKIAGQLVLATVGMAVGVAVLLIGVSQMMGF